MLNDKLVGFLLLLAFIHESIRFIFLVYRYILFEEWGGRERERGKRGKIIKIQYILLHIL